MIEVLLENLDTELTEVALRRLVIRIHPQYGLQNLDSARLVTAAHGGPVLAENGMVFTDFLAVETLEHIDVVFGEIGAEVDVFLLAEFLPLGIPCEREALHEVQRIGGFFRQLERRKFLAATDQGDALVQPLVDDGTIAGILLGEGMENGIGRPLTEDLLDAIYESVNIHGNILLETNQLRLGFDLAIAKEAQ